MHTSGRGTPVAVDVSSTDCPVSLITQESRDYMETYSRVRRTGVPLYGQDLSQWPVWAVDMMNILDIEKDRTDSALNNRPHEED